MSRIDETRNAKIQKRQALEKLGVSVHPYGFNKTHTIAQARASEGTESEIKTAGRIMSVREHGKLRFFDLSDSTGSVQVLIRTTDLAEDQTRLLPLIDRSDFLGVTGKVGISKSGEVSIYAQSITFLGKALLPLPTEFNTAEDKEVRFRKRYIDMLINEQTRKVLDARWLIVKEVRRYLQDEHSFTEVETPIFQPLYGGTNAKPFTTHMNALDCDYYLRLAPELYLKRLIVGGYDKVFEIARNFRNEGIDQTHQPEFSMIEWYETYADYHRMMDVAEGMLQHIAKKLYDTTKVMVGTEEIDIGGTWPRI
ncbi:lysine--tRNA ligase, partial [Candidatus Woesebacteria bacterium]|nr:lysine--tRNA ligase [Candidatus Woesebacteria bacterium]